MNLSGIRKLICVLLAFLLLFSCTACKNSGDKVLITCNGLSVTQSTFLLLMTEQATELWGEEGITQDNLTEKAKEAVLAYLPIYTYCVQGYQAAGYTLSEEDRGQLQVSILSGLIDSGLDYEADKKDAVFLNTFGVTFAQYMQYQEDAYLRTYFYQEDLKKIKIEDEELFKAYFREHQAEYAICTADVFRYPKSADGNWNTAAKAAQEKLKGNSTLEECKEDGICAGWEKAEQLTFDRSSNLDKAFGEGFVSAMVTMEEGQVLWKETEAFVTVARLTSLAGYTEHLKTIKEILQQTLYEEKLAETVNTQAYRPEIVDRKAYDAIVEIPGGHLQ